jgi:hypothetical protein
MRTVDEPERFKGLGEKVTPKPAPAPASSSPPRGPSGLVTDKDGRMSTTNHKPHSALTLEEAIANWHELYASDMTLDFLP